MKDLTLIIPAKNESESLPTVLQSLKKIDCKIIVSLQGNDYETIDSIKDYEVKIINQTNRGYGNALIEGINACNTKFFCIFNADGSFDENDLFKMYELNLDKDFVFTSRYKKNGGSDDDTLVTYIGNQIFSTLGRLLYSLKIDDILYTFLMGKTESFKKLNVKRNDFRFCVEFPIKMQKSNMIYTSIASHEKCRIAGVKKVNAIKDGFLILKEMLVLFFVKN
jgi:glycosyltransferase involved in cell wall biosynthesis